MDPAPEPNSVITMPSAHRVVSRSAAMLAEHGYDTPDALRVIWSSARHAWADLTAIGIGQLDWLESIWRDAEARPGFPPPITANRKDTNHGGETRSEDPGRQQ